MSRDTARPECAVVPPAWEAWAVATKLNSQSLTVQENREVFVKLINELPLSQRVLAEDLARGALDRLAGSARAAGTRAMARAMYEY